MIRTMWLALFCLIGLCVVAAVKVATAPFTSVSAIIANDGAGTDPITVGSNVQQDSLSKADRLPVAYIGVEEALEPNLVAPIKIVHIAPSPATKRSKIVSRHWHDPNAIGATDKSSQRRHARNK